MGAGLLFWALVGCIQAPLLEPLPDTLTAVVSLARGGHASMIVELHRPGTEPTVRLVPGIVAVGPGWVHSLEVGSAPCWTDLGPGSAAAACHETVGAALLDTPPISGPWDGAGHDGPGHGFQLRLRGEALELLLPKMDPGLWATLLRGVERIEGVWWFQERRLPDWEKGEIHRRFKRVGAVPIGDGVATIDGDLGEWADARASPVDDDGQLLEGHDGWTGPRDGSFGVALRRRRGAMLLGIRVRDDVLVPGQDHLVLMVGDAHHKIPLLPGSVQEEGDLRAVVGPKLGHGLAVEVELQHAAEPEAGHLVVQLVDVDPGESTTRMGTAGYPALVDLRQP
jgi:hypothetical protein